VDVLICADLSVQRVTEEKWKEFGDVKGMVGENGRVLMGEDDLLYRVFTEMDFRIVLPKKLRSALLKLVQESKVVVGIRCVPDDCCWRWQKMCARRLRCKRLT
jgi:predicted site-specific integrase-resolvase